MVRCEKYIELFISSFVKELSPIRKDIILFGPCMTQFLTANLYEVTNAMTNLNFEQKEFAIFCNNNYRNDLREDEDFRGHNPTRGSHWSLLVYSKQNQMIFHFDSIEGLNHTCDIYRKAYNISDNNLTKRYIRRQQNKTFSLGPT